MSPHPLIRTRRSRLGYWCDVLLTAVGWLLFAFLFASGIFSVLNGDLRGPQSLPVSALFVSRTSPLLIYAIPALISAAVLIGWARYNNRRFSGKTRRQHTQPLPLPHLQSSFDLSQALFDRARDARMMVITHEEDSTISRISSVSPGSHAPNQAPVEAPIERAYPLLPKVQEAAPPHRNWSQQPQPAMLYNDLRFQPAADSPLPAATPAQ